MSITSRLSLHKPDLASEAFGDYFITAYAADLQQIDDSVQIVNLAGAGNIPVYDANGLLVDSGIAPADVPTGIDSILTDRGMMLYKNATVLAALSPSTAGKSLMTQGVGADPVFGYPAHSTLTGLTTGDPHTQYHTDARGDARYAPVANGVTGGDSHNALHDATYAPIAKGVTGGDAHASRHKSAGADSIKLDELAAPTDVTTLDASTSAHGLMQKYPNTKQRLLGDGTWATPVFEAKFPFGDGSAVLAVQSSTIEFPAACKITRARIRSQDANADLLSGSVTATFYVHDYNVDADSVASSGSIVLSSASTNSEVEDIAIAADKMVTVRLSGISLCKQLIVSLKMEAT